MARSLIIGNFGICICFLGEAGLAIENLHSRHIPTLDCLLRLSTKNLFADNFVRCLELLKKLENFDRRRILMVVHSNENIIAQSLEIVRASFILGYGKYRQVQSICVS